MNGIYWDCDGTLMDTETSYGLAWKEHLSEFGLEISEEETRQSVSYTHLTLPTTPYV